MLKHIKWHTETLFSQFDSAVEDFDCYGERKCMYFEVNAIAEGRQKIVFLSLMGPKQYSLLRSLCAPDAPLAHTYDQLVTTLYPKFGNVQMKRSIEKNRFFLRKVSSSSRGSRSRSRSSNIEVPYHHHHSDPSASRHLHVHVGRLHKENTTQDFDNQTK